MIDQHDSENDFEVQLDKNGITITKYIGSKTKVHIPPVIQNLPVTGIGLTAFANYKNLTSVIIPDSVINIGLFAFYNCTNLTNVIIGNSVTDIGFKAFYNCASLNNITIPNSVKSIGHWAFIECINLTRVTFESLINLSFFHTNAFLGDLYNKFYEIDPNNGTSGTYITTAPVSRDSVWTKE